MSVIIRLQNLPWSANALDIRQFFNGLSIPEGGVHIVGGELGDAFIAFSTDEDARQAFNRNGGKIKEVQIKLMLSSRTEMQKVIEAARNPLAAFMQATPASQALPAIIPAAIPAAVPEIKKEDNKEKEKRDRRRSRSRSRDRKERSRDRDRDRRDRRRRDRSRSRSRDRRDRRRRDRSHSRERRSKDRDRRSKDRRQSEDKTGSSSNSSLNNAQKDQSKLGIWEDPVRSEQQPSPALQQAQAILNSFIPNSLEEARRNLNALAPAPLVLATNRNGFPNQNDTFSADRNRENWNSNGPVRQGDGRHDFLPRFNRNIQGTRTDDDKFNVLPSRGLLNQPFGGNQRMGFNRPPRADGRGRFDTSSERPGLLERPALLERPSLFDRPHNDYLKSCCVQLRPYWGGYGEVRRFFHGIFIHNTGIKFINDDKGKRTGIVYIRFANPDGKENALQRNGGQLKGQTVDIKHLDDDVFDKTVDRFQPDYNREHDQDSPDRSFKNRNSPIFNKSPREFSCLAIEDLPLFTKEQDMLKIFSDYSLLSILLVNKQRHIIAYIKFSNADDAKKAQTERGKHIFDGKPLNIRPCSDEEYAIISHEEPESDEVIEVEDDEPKPLVTSDCISLSGLPLKTTDRDVSDFFSDVAIVPNKIHLINSNLGFTGLAYCEFASIKQAISALDKDGFPLGSGTVTVKSIPRSEMESKIGIAAPSNNMTISRPPNQIRPPFFPRGFGHGHFPGPRGMGLMGHRPPMRRFPTPPGDPSELAPPGCTVRMENVPYKAVLDEILEFFDGFEVPADNVLRRYNENGTPSGEAKVIFKSAEDAFQAVQERHHGKIRERTVFLSQC